MAKASVIIPTFADWPSLAECLSCLQGQSVSSDRFEIVIGNNNPEPALPEGFVLPPNCQVVWQPRPGSYAARNAAVAQACGEVLFFTDSDCRPQPDWIARGLALLEQRPETDRIGGYIRLYPRGEGWTLPELYDKIFGLRQDRHTARGYAATANLIVRHALFRQVGPFEETLYSSGDKEWNQRATAQGSKIFYGADVIVAHPARASFAALRKKRLRILGGRFQLRRARGKPIRPTLPKYLFPSVSVLTRLLREPGLSAMQVVRLWALDYRLRLAEFRELLALLRAGGSARRA
ncbi:hypothetical protein C8N32_103188 [Rhodovulum imhoffii]|uniref:Glycosyltransferase 2-like domain-containing protein n=1 Tax=Rhodovulum imhoffii TaxID=365340 RepID=A0A2T5BUZ7_9RHOB|nr:glycosyltransferase [Rhodovulum imhoffii]PTN03345.1 hypothetical protein C8N32_103188 [Rhodovulum imhoffii]